MLKWWRGLVYKSDVIPQLMMMTLLVGKRAGQLLGKHPGISQAIRRNYDDGTPAMVTATHLAAALMANAIERVEDMVRKQIIEQLLNEWSQLEPAEQRQISRHLADGTLEQDMLLTRCQWLLIRGQDLLIEKKIEMHDFRILKDSIWGPLKGETSAQRMFVRLDEALDGILDHGTHKAKGAPGFPSAPSL